MLRNLLLPLILLLTSGQNTNSQQIDTSSFRINTRLSFYTYEKEGETLLHVPQSLIYRNLEVILKINDSAVNSWKGKPGKKLVRIPFPVALQPAEYNIEADISVAGSGIRYISSCTLTILEIRPNEVKTDRLTGGLIVGKRELFPFGFYCYTPVHPTLPEEEVVRGFNMISPYQRILPQTLGERKAYMDRCAQLGMKVHYNLLSVSGGGGVGSRIPGLTEQQKNDRLLNEINAFKDHPALLAWYIADEPTGNNMQPDSLLKIYKIIRKTDPWHPVSVVFMAPFMSSKKYADCLDIVMADPYPVPDSPISMVGDAAGSLAAEFSGRNPVWIVPQAFGGGEWWGREPTLQEIRAMTYQSIINGARGIQYFIRNGLNFFPKSTSTWGECGRMAVEIAELTPWLLSDEDNIPVRSVSRNVILTSAVHEGQLMIMAVNKTNSPQSAGYSIAKPLSGKADVIFENRSITVNNGYFSDQLSAFGTQVYMIDLVQRKDPVKPWRDNFVRDPGFEDTSSPGVPASCYARNGGDRGATYFLDSREHFEGNHSIRLVTPKENGSVRLRFFPVTVRDGGAYYISIRAKADVQKGGLFEISFGEYGSARFELTDEWKEFVTIVTIPYYNDLPPKTNVILQMPSAGVAWFDMLQVAECVDIKKSINPELIFNEFQRLTP
jgi:hypothetical protein